VQMHSYLAREAKYLEYDTSEDLESLQNSEAPNQAGANRMSQCSYCRVQYDGVRRAVPVIARTGTQAASASGRLESGGSPSESSSYLINP
jgi:hypothetical protein